MYHFISVVGNRIVACRNNHTTIGSQMFCWHVSEDGGEPKVIDVTLASLHGPIDREPGAHVFYDSRAAWTVVNDELPKLGGATGLEPLAVEDASSS